MTDAMKASTRNDSHTAPLQQQLAQMSFEDFERGAGAASTSLTHSASNDEPNEKILIKKVGKKKAKPSKSSSKPSPTASTKTTPTKAPENSAQSSVQLSRPTQTRSNIDSGETLSKDSSSAMARRTRVKSRSKTNGKQSSEPSTDPTNGVQKPTSNGAKTTTSAKDVPTKKHKTEVNATAGRAKPGSEERTREPPAGLNVEADRNVATGNGQASEENNASMTATQLRKDERVRTQEWRRRKDLDEAVQRATLLLQMERHLNADRQQSLTWISDGATKQETLNELLGRQVNGLWKSTRPLSNSIAARQELIKDVENALNRRWAKCGLRVVPFGSTMTGLVEATSDVDLCLIDPTRPNGVGTPADHVKPLPRDAACGTLSNPHIVGIEGMPDFYSVRSIARALEHHSCAEKFSDVLPITHANVPIVKFIHRPTGLSCDLNVNDTFGLHNSMMIRAYLDFAPAIVEPFVFCIKKWAAMRGINDPAGEKGMASFNSYTVVLIALQYLQWTDALPNLQDPHLIRTSKTPSKHVWQRPPMKFTRRGRGKGDAAATVSPSALSEPTSVHHYEKSTPTCTPGKIPADERTGARFFDTTFAIIDANPERVSPQVVESVEEASTGGRSTMVRLLCNKRTIDEFLGDLVVGFFDWFATFDFDRCGFSLREGRPFLRSVDATFSDDAAAKAGSRDGKFAHVPAWNERWTQNPILCQDPFILDRNTSGAILKHARDIIIDEAKRAKNLFRVHYDVDEEGDHVEPALLSDLLEDYEYERLRDHHLTLIKDWSAERKKQLNDMARTKYSAPEQAGKFARFKVPGKRKVRNRAA